MAKPETQAISLRIPVEKVAMLENLAQATDRPRSWHIEQALDAYIAQQAWQVAQIEKSIAEIDAGEGIPHEEIVKELLTWGKESESDPAK